MLGNNGFSDQVLKAFVQKQFQIYDTDKSGGLDVYETKNLFTDMFKKLGISSNVTLQQAQQVIKQVDKDKNGTIQREQLFVAFKDLLNKIAKKQETGGYPPNQFMYSPYPYPYGPIPPTQYPYNHYGYGLNPYSMTMGGNMGFNMNQVPNQTWSQSPPQNQNNQQGVGIPRSNTSPPSANMPNPQMYMSTSKYGGGWSSRRR